MHTLYSISFNPKLSGIRISNAIWQLRKSRLCNLLSLHKILFLISSTARIEPWVSPFPKSITICCTLVTQSVFLTTPPMTPSESLLKLQHLKPCLRSTDLGSTFFQWVLVDVCACWSLRPFATAHGLRSGSWSQWFLGISSEPTGVYIPQSNYFLFYGYFCQTWRSLSICDRAQPPGLRCPLKLEAKSRTGFQPWPCWIWNLSGNEAKFSRVLTDLLQVIFIHAWSCPKPPCVWFQAFSNVAQWLSIFLVFQISLMITVNKW